MLVWALLFDCLCFGFFWLLYVFLFFFVWLFDCLFLRWSLTPWRRLIWTDCVARTGFELAALTLPSLWDAGITGMGHHIILLNCIVSEGAAVLCLTRSFLYPHIEWNQMQLWGCTKPRSVWRSSAYSWSAKVEREGENWSKIGWELEA